MRDSETASRKTTQLHPLLVNEAMWSAQKDDSTPPEEAADKNPIVERIVMQVTEDDLCRSIRSGLNNPILCVLQRQTSTLWRLSDDGFAIEVMAPNRVCQLPPEALRQWNTWRQTGVWEGEAWIQDFLRLTNHDMASLIENRSLNLHEINVLRGREK